MTAKQLFQAGQVREAQKQLNAYVRDHPSDVVQRTFLFELLCFSGDYDRAEKQRLTQGAAALAALHFEKVLDDSALKSLEQTKKEEAAAVSRTVRELAGRETRQKWMGPQTA